MAYYTERHGMRTPIAKTYDISAEQYSMLFHCCEKYYDNLAWKYPMECQDGYGCCGINQELFQIDLRYEIPDLYREDDGCIAAPAIPKNSWSSSPKYNQYALLDLIELFAENIHDIVVGAFHSYWGHHHLTLKDSRDVFRQFRDEINGIFTKTGLLYHLNENSHVERIIEYSPVTPSVECLIAEVKETGTRELLQEAILLHKSHSPADNRYATEKIWDAFERLKTYYSAMDKRDSAAKVVADISNNHPKYADIFDSEFKTLSNIGNGFRIRHHETDKVEIPDIRYYDYFFNRCLSLIALAIQYLK